MTEKTDLQAASAMRSLHAHEIEHVSGGMTHTLISDDCCKNPRITSEQNGDSTTYTVDCD